MKWTEYDPEFAIELDTVRAYGVRSKNLPRAKDSYKDQALRLLVVNYLLEQELKGNKFRIDAAVDLLDGVEIESLSEVVMKSPQETQRLVNQVMR